MSLSRVSRAFLATGLVLPCLLNGLLYLKVLPVDRTPLWLLLICWPAVGFYMSSNVPVWGFLLSVLANGVVYLLVGISVSCLHRFLSARSSNRAAQS